ncbi:hypothetical protein IMX07_10925 [bacterium]|jgi:hypothetical protein|nr:hypothetical protein [bacterium]
MIAGMFNEWFTLSHRTAASDGQGGVTYSFTAYATERGRMSHLGKMASKSEEKLIGGALQEVIAHILYLRNGVPVERGDQVVDSSGVAYEVLAVRYPSALPRNHIECECREMQKGA